MITIQQLAGIAFIILSSMLMGAIIAANAYHAGRTSMPLMSIPKFRRRRDDDDDEDTKQNQQPVRMRA